MVFSSLVFLLLFLPPVLIVCRLIPERFRNLWLTAASFAFYALGEPRFVLLLAAEVLWNWAGALAAERFRGRPAGRAAVLFCVLADLGALLLFKYSRFFCMTVNSLFGAGLSLPALALPIGISFYTFQEISYVVDVNRGCSARKNPVDTALYLAFFPQLIAGPIVRYREIEPQLSHRSLTWEGVSSGFIRFCIGLSKKVLLANQLSITADHVFGVFPRIALPAPLLWLGAVCYSLQLFFDFSGYSDMAIGLGTMFGFRLPENFRDPYTARTVKEFWSRWHITLSAWFRDYVYIPLGGSRVSRLKTLRNLALVWALTGLWHGANWTFVLWGLLWGTLAALERFLLRPQSRSRAFQAVWRALLSVCIVLLWTVFRSPNVSFALRFIGRMFAPSAWLQSATSLLMLRTWWHESWFYCIAGALLALCVPQRLCRAVVGADPPAWLELVRLSILALTTLLAFSFLVSGSYNPFLYFQF